MYRVISLVIFISYFCRIQKGDQCLENNISDSISEECTQNEINKYSDLANNVLVLTVATSQTEGYERYLRSSREYGIEPIILGLGTEWRGGDIKRSAGGGYKVNLLRKEIEAFKDDSEKIILFTDAYDVIFLSNLQSIIDKFKQSEARVLFSAESSCWPDSSLANKYPKPIKGKRFLNSGAFIAFAPELHEILNSEELADDDDDQLFYTRIYLNEEKRNKLQFKLDHVSEIFQNLYGALNDVELQFDDKEAYLENVAYQTRPLILHGNGVSKVPFNALTNYLARSWTPELGCVACKDNLIKLSDLPEEKVPVVLMGLFVEQATPFFEEMLQKIHFLDYPKSRIHLFIHNAIGYHKEHITTFLGEFGTEYASVKQINPDDETNEWSARNLALDHCLKKRCDAFFTVDSIVHLDNPHTLRLLLEQNRSVVAPLLVRPGKAWSNFWGALTTDGFYARSTDYMDIVHNERRGLWNVPFINNCYMINATVLRQYERKKLNYIREDLDADMGLCANLRDLGIFMYVSNRLDFGHLINPETYDITKAAPDMYQIFENAQDWEYKYIHAEYPEGLNPDKQKLMQPCPDVYWFPITTMRFCTDLIHMMETFGRWSDGSNTDARLEGGYEAVPTRDIHMNQVGWERHWLHFLKQYVRPLQEHVFTGYFHDPPRSLMNFVVRYRPDEQPFLRPHHDSSTYTINIALNTAGVDYTGGGCKFIRYNCSVVDTKPGWMLMHPGRLTHFHEGLRVTNGTRYIMIAFVDP